MIDNLVILLTCGAGILVAWRAVGLDRKIPWFIPLQQQTQTPAPRGRRFRRS